MNIRYATHREQYPMSKIVILALFYRNVNNKCQYLFKNFPPFLSLFFVTAIYCSTRSFIFKVTQLNLFLFSLFAFFVNIMKRLVYDPSAEKGKESPSSTNSNPSHLFSVLS